MSTRKKFKQKTHLNPNLLVFRMTLNALIMHIKQKSHRASAHNEAKPPSQKLVHMNFYCFFLQVVPMLI